MNHITLCQAGSSILPIQGQMEEYQVSKKLELNLNLQSQFESQYHLASQSIKDFFEKEEVKLINENSQNNQDELKNLNYSYEIARIQFILKKYQDSLNNYSKKRDSEQTLIEKNAILFNQGLLHLELGNINESIKQLDVIINQQNVDKKFFISTIIAKALSLIKHGNLREAEQILQENYNQNEPQAELVSLIGYILIEQGQYKEALKHFQENIQYTTGVQNELAITYNGKGIAHFYLGEVQEALFAFQKATESDPSEYIYKNNLIIAKMILSNSEKDINDCLNIALRCKQQEGSESTQIWFLCAKLFMKLKLFREVLECIKQLIKLLDNSSNEGQENIVRFQILQAMLYRVMANFGVSEQVSQEQRDQFLDYCLKDCNEGIQKFNQWNQFGEFQPYVHYFYGMLGLISMQKKDYKNGEEHFLEGIKRIQQMNNPSQQQTDNLQIYYLNVTYIYIQLNKLNQALSHLNNVTQKKYDVLAQYYKSEILVKQKNYEQAIQIINKIQFNNDFSDQKIKFRLQILQGICYLMSNNIEKAWTLIVPLKKIIFKNQQEYGSLISDTSIRYYLSVLYYQKQLYHKAKKVLDINQNQILNDLKNIPHLHLAQCYSAVCEQEKSLECFEIALQEIKNKIKNQQQMNNLNNSYLKDLHSEQFTILVQYAQYRQTLSMLESSHSKISEQLFAQAFRQNSEGYYYYAIYLSESNNYDQAIQQLYEYQKNNLNSQKFVNINRLLAMHYFLKRNYGALNQLRINNSQSFPKTFLEFQKSYTNQLNYCLYTKLMIFFDIIEKKYNNLLTPQEFQKQPLTLVSFKSDKLFVYIAASDLEHVFMIFCEINKRLNFGVVNGNLSSNNSLNSQESSGSLNGQQEARSTIDNKNNQVNEIDCLHGQSIFNFIFQKTTALGPLHLQFFLNMLPYKIVHELFSLYQKLGNLLNDDNSQQLEKNKCVIMLILRIVEVIQLLQKLNFPVLKFSWVELIMAHGLWIQKKEQHFQLNKPTFKNFNSLSIIKINHEKDIYQAICYLQRFILQSYIDPSETLKLFCNEAVKTDKQIAYCERFKMLLQIELLAYSQITADQIQQQNFFQNSLIINLIVQNLYSSSIKYQVNIKSQAKNEQKNLILLKPIKEKLIQQLNLNLSMFEYISSNFAQFLLEIYQNDIDVKSVIQQSQKERKVSEAQYLRQYIQREREFQKENNIYDWRELYINELLENKQNFINEQYMIQFQQTDQQVQKLIYSILLFSPQQDKDIPNFLEQAKQNENLKPIIQTSENLNTIYTKTVKNYTCQNPEFIKKKFDEIFEILYKYRYKYNEEEKTAKIYKQVVQKLNLNIK